MRTAILDPNTRIIPQPPQRLLSRSSIFIASVCLIILSLRAPLPEASALLAASAGVIGLLAWRLLRQVDQLQTAIIEVKRSLREQACLERRLDRHVFRPIRGQARGLIDGQSGVYNVPGVWLPVRQK